MFVEPHEKENKVFADAVVKALKEKWKVKVENREYRDGVRRLYRAFIENGDEIVLVEFSWRNDYRGPVFGLKVSVRGNYGECREQVFNPTPKGWSENAVSNIVKKVEKDLATMAANKKKRVEQQLAKDLREKVLEDARKKVAAAGYDIGYYAFSADGLNNVSIDIGKISISQFFTIAYAMAEVGVIRKNRKKVVDAEICFL